VTPFSRFRSQASRNTGGQHNTLRLSHRDANWIEHAESKARGCLAHIRFEWAGVEMFFKLGTRALEMLQAPRYLNPALGRTRSGADSPLGYEGLSLGPPTSGAQNVRSKDNF